MIRSAGVLVALAAAAHVQLANAHHSFASVYDAKRSMLISGTIEEVEWFNPHARFIVAVSDEGGTIETWDCELASPNGLMRKGWTRTTLKVGDEVVVDGYGARDGSAQLFTRSVTLPDGTVLQAEQGPRRGTQ